MVYLDYRNFPRNVYVLFLIQLITRTGDFISPLFALVLIREFNLNVEIVSRLLATNAILGLAAFLGGGWLADYFGRKRTFVIGQTVYSALLLFCVFGDKIYFKVSCLIMASFFNNFTGPTIASVMSDLLPVQKRKNGFTLLYLGINVGYAISPLLASALLEFSLNVLCCSSVLIATVGSVIFWTFFKNDKSIDCGNVSSDRNRENVFRTILRRPVLGKFLALYLIYSVIYMQIQFSLPLYINSSFYQSGIREFSKIMTINALLVVFFSLAINSYTNKYSKMFNTGIAGLFFAVGFGMLGIRQLSFSWIVMSTVLWSVGEILMSTNVGVFVINSGPSTMKAQFSALVYFISSLGGIIGHIFVGKYVHYYGIHTIWGIVFVLSVVSAFGMFYLGFKNGEKM